MHDQQDQEERETHHVDVRERLEEVLAEPPHRRERHQEHHHRQHHPRDARNRAEQQIRVGLGPVEVVVERDPVDLAHVVFFGELADAASQVADRVERAVEGHDVAAKAVDDDVVVEPEQELALALRPQVGEQFVRYCNHKNSGNGENGAGTASANYDPRSDVVSIVI